MYTNKENNDLINILKDYNKVTRSNNKIKKQNYINRIQSGKTYVLYMRYKNKTGLESFEEIELEGWKNAITIFEMYRGFGHNMKLDHLQLSLEGEKLKRINFDYGRKF